MNITTLTLDKPRITDFAKERNELLESAKTDWVLFLDKDEKLSKKINLDDKEFDAYYLTRNNYFLGKFVGSEKLIRLVKKGTGKWERKVHETWVTKQRVGEIKDNFIIHNTADTLSGYVKKINYYSDLHAIANKEEGKKSNLFKIIIFPIFKFIETLIKSRNVVFSIMQSLHSFLSWTKLLFYYS